MGTRQAGLELCLLSPDILGAWSDSMVVQVKGSRSCFARNRSKNDSEGEVKFIEEEKQLHKMSNCKTLSV